MRDIETKIVAALLLRRPFKNGTRDAVVFHADGAEVLLHGSTLAFIPSNNLHAPPRVLVSLCGWNTPTTRSRINAVLHGLGVDARVFTKRGTPMLEVAGVVKEIDPAASYPIALPVLARVGEAA